MKKKECYISLAHIVCSLAVVMIHTNGCFKEFNISRCWFLANVIDCGLGFAVPVFFMLTGVTLIDYTEKYSTFDYFVKRIKKTVVPFCFWSFFGFLYGNITGNTSVLWIYHFFVNLFGVYLCIPLFSLVKKEYKTKVFHCIVLVSFIVNYLVPFLCELFNKEYTYRISFGIGSDYLIYVLMGYLISKYEIPLRKRIFIYSFGVLGYILHIGGTYVMSIEKGCIENTFRGYTNFPCFLSAVATFVFIKYICEKIHSERIIGFINILSDYTFAVYLIHFYVVNIFTKQVFTNLHSFEYRIFTPFLTFVICVIITYILRKIPLIRRVLP